MIILKHQVIFYISKLRQTSQHVDDGNNYDGQTNIQYILEGRSIFGSFGNEPMQTCSVRRVSLSLSSSSASASSSVLSSVSASGICIGVCVQPSQ